MYLERIEKECRYQYLSPKELLSRLEKKAILYLPVGSLEWHNEHLPLGTDTFHAMQLSMRLCADIGGVVLPGFWWNTGGCHDHATTYHMPEELYRTTLKNVCLGLVSIPARMLVLVNGHGGDFQRETPAALAQEINNADFPIHVVVADPYGLGTSSSYRIDHADTGETSLSLELIPHLVRMDREIGPDLYSNNKPFGDGQPNKKGGDELYRAFLSDARELIHKEYLINKKT